MKSAASALILTAALAGGARAADLPSYKAFADAPPPVFTWGGFYAGLNLGGGFRSSGPSDGGVLGGGQIGYNYRLGPLFVVGVETDFQGTSLGGDRGPPGFGPPDRSTGLDWFGTARGRIGVTPFGSNLLFYGTGGYAYGHDGVRTRDGWTAGGGVEWAFAPSWSVKAEYLYTDFGESGRPQFFGPRAADSFHTVRVGVNYHFDLLSPRATFAR